MPRVEDHRTPEQIERHIRNQKAWLRRRRTNPGPAHRYTCVGGPWHGEQIALRTRSTAQLRMGQWRGRYVVERVINPITGSDERVAWEAAA